MKTWLVVLELGALLVLPGMLAAQDAGSGDRSPSSTVACVPSALPPVSDSSLQGKSPINTMCSASNRLTWQGTTIDVTNDQEHPVGPIGRNVLSEHSYRDSGVDMPDPYLRSELYLRPDLR